MKAAATWPTGQIPLVEECYNYSKEFTRRYAATGYPVARLAVSAGHDISVAPCGNCDRCMRHSYETCKAHEVSCKWYAPQSMSGTRERSS